MLLTFPRHKLHVVLDEIYALSVFEGSFTSSVFALDDIPDPQRTHWIWGFSKVHVTGESIKSSNSVKLFPALKDNENK